MFMTEAVAAPLWREPTQERSRVRFERMLDVAGELVRERGLDALTMQDVAAGAGVSIGSLYQFFPDRNALIARIFSDSLDAIDEDVLARFRGVSSLEQFETASAGLIESIYQHVSDDPALAEIWSTVQASRALRHLDVDDSERIAGVVFEAARPLAPESVSDQRLWTACFLICDLTSSATHRALTRPGREGRRLVREYALMARSYLRSVFDGEPAR